MNLSSRRQNQNPLSAFMSDSFNGLLDLTSSPQGTSALMRSDIIEYDSEFKVVIDLPGYNKENVSADIKEGVLTVLAETHEEKEENDGTFVKKERFSGRASRSFYLGEEIEEDLITARYERGVLTIVIPKKKKEPAPEESKKISID